MLVGDDMNLSEKNMKMDRRGFLSNLLKGAACIVTVASLPRLALAAWNEKAFKAETLEGAMSSKYPGLEFVDSSAIKLKAPAIAENGAVVPITVESKLANTKSISLFVPDNPGPLVVKFNFGAGSVPKVKTRIRMGKTSEVIALVEADGKLHRTRQAVKVTIGGCGG